MDIFKKALREHKRGNIKMSLTDYKAMLELFYLEGLSSVLKTLNKNLNEKKNVTELAREILNTCTKAMCKLEISFCEKKKIPKE